MIRTTTWTGKIGLIYQSDYGYVSTNANCRNYINAKDEDKRYCNNNNWLQTIYHYWTLSPYVHQDLSNLSCGVLFQGFINSASTQDDYNVRPSVYLKSNVYITSGEGSSTNPYKLSM